MSTVLQKKNLLSIKNAAYALDMPIKTLRGLINKGALPYLQPVQYGKIYLAATDLDAWIIQERRVG